MQLQTENLGKVAITIEEDFWRNYKDYEKLTIVEKEGTYGTYISRKPVPAGTPLTNRKYWIPFSSLKEEILLNYNKWVNDYGKILSSQATTLNQVQSTINEIYSHLPKGVLFSGDKTFFNRNGAEDVVLTASTINGEEAEFTLYKNNEVLHSETSNGFTYTDTVSGDSEYKLVCFQDNYKYVSTWNVAGALPLYAGAGSVYTDIINDAHVVKIDADISGIYPIACADGDSILFVTPKDCIIQAMRMNGIEVPLKNVRTVNLGTDYLVYQSYNIYQEGTYPIQINEYTGLNGDDFLSLLNAVSDAAPRTSLEQLAERVTGLEEEVDNFSYSDLKNKPIIRLSGTTAERPVGKHIVDGETVGTLAQSDIGFMYFDTTLGLPIFATAIVLETGVVTWKDAMGTDVSNPGL